MRYKLMAIDMDGTILDPQKKIRKNTVLAIQKAIDLGVYFVISTGRPSQGVEKYSEISEIASFIITYNGAVIFSPKEQRVLYEVCLEEKVALEITHFGKKLGATMCLWVKNKLYAFELNERVDYYASLSGIKPILINDLKHLVCEGVTKALWFDDADVIKEYQKKLKGNLKGNVTYCTSDPCFLEFFSGEASKGNALRFLEQHLNVERSKMIAIGDGMNDLTMLEYAGLGIAMDNAPDELKSLADDITLSNDEDGVVHVIEKYILA